MKNLRIYPLRGLRTGSVIDIVDNSGIKKIQCIARLGYKGTRRRYPLFGVGDIITGTPVETQGVKRITKERILTALIVQQRTPVRRANGMRFINNINGAIIINPKNNEPIGTKINVRLMRELGLLSKKIVQISKGVY